MRKLLKKYDTNLFIAVSYMILMGMFTFVMGLFTGQNYYIIITAAMFGISLFISIFMAVFTTVEVYMKD